MKTCQTLDVLGNTEMNARVYKARHDNDISDDFMFYLFFDISKSERKKVLRRTFCDI